jgi:hypothetical protein
MIDKLLDALMLVFWVGIGIGLVSAVIPALGGVAHWIAFAAGNTIALLAAVGMVVLLVTSVTRRNSAQ